MYSLTSQLRKLRNWWFYLCTGRRDFGSLDEENYRQRILVMTSCFWLITVVLYTISTPLAVNLGPEGRVAAQVLFVSTILGVLLSMAILRILGDRIMALNVMLFIYTGAFIGACLFFGGTDSPTFPLLVLAPAMAGIAGSVRLSVGWGVLVLLSWSAMLMAERAGFQFAQIILPQNHNLAMVLAYTAMSIAVVSVIIIYAEMNKSLRLSLQQSNIELEHLSSHDQLTRLPNRRFYDERMILALQRAAEHDGLTGLLFLDLNGFKKINDIHGHGAGDKLLVAVAQRVRQNLRETDLVARLGGDEFAVVLEDVNSPDQVARIAHKLSEAIEQPLAVRQTQLHFSASIGVAIYPIDGRQKQELEEKADKAMYLAKKRSIPVALCSLEATNMPTPARAPVHRI